MFYINFTVYLFLFLFFKILIYCSTPSVIFLSLLLCMHEGRTVGLILIVKTSTC